MITSTRTDGVAPEGVSLKSYRFLCSLVAERDEPALGVDADTRRARVDETLEHMPADARQRWTSRTIGQLLARPRVTATRSTDAGSREVAVDLTPGVYEVAAGEIYVVKPNREKTRLYAKRLVEINSDRLNERDERVKIEFEYAPGAIFKIMPEHRMDAARGKALTIRYGRCICCGKVLKQAQSVERGIGPVCIKYFRVV